MGVMISYRSWDDQALGKVLEELERGCRARERMSRSMQTCGVETQARKWEGAGRSGFWRQMDKIVIFRRHWAECGREACRGSREGGRPEWKCLGVRGQGRRETFVFLCFLGFCMKYLQRGRVDHVRERGKGEGEERRDRGGIVSELFTELNVCLRDSTTKGS